jgi:hypothetical protein
MFMGQIQAFERDGTAHIVERLWEGGVRELVLGDLVLHIGGVQGPAFAPNVAQYEGIEKQPPALPEELESASRIFRDAVKAGADQGFELYFHDWGQFGWFGPGSCLNNPEQLRYGLARTRDTFERYPETHGFVLDGPEYGYEIEPGHRSDLFNCFCEHCERKARELGYDFSAMKEAAEGLRARLRALSPEVMRGFIATQTGPFDAVDLLLQEPVLFDWLRFKTDCIQDYVGAFYACVKEIDPRLKLACGPRTSAFAPLTGYNYRRLSEVTDFIAPKLYFWQHGIDGLKGTVHRYAKTLMEWDEGADEGLALDFVFHLFGFTMAGVQTLEALSKPLNAAFFKETLPGEIAKMIFRTGSVERLKPWVGLHHGGVRISTYELELMLEAVVDSGLQSFIYWHYSDMTEEEWKILREYAD